VRSRVRASEEGEDFADGGFPAGGLGQWQVGLELVAVAAAVFLLDHVAGLGETGRDAVGAALGDAQAGRDVAQPRARGRGRCTAVPGRGWSGNPSSPCQIFTNTLTTIPSPTRWRSEGSAKNLPRVLMAASFSSVCFGAGNLTSSWSSRAWHRAATRREHFCRRKRS
jgi:hypothetical protein